MAGVRVLEACSSKSETNNNKVPTGHSRQMPIVEKSACIGVYGLTACSQSRCCVFFLSSNYHHLDWKKRECIDDSVLSRTIIGCWETRSCLWMMPMLLTVSVLLLRPTTKTTTMMMSSCEDLWQKDDQEDRIVPRNCSCWC